MKRQVLITRQYMSDIGDTLRDKLDEDRTYKPIEMADAIERIAALGKKQYPKYNYALKGSVNVAEGFKIGPFNDVSSFIRPLDSEGNDLDVDVTQNFEINSCFTILEPCPTKMAVFGNTEGGWRRLPGVDVLADNSGIDMQFGRNGTSWDTSASQKIRPSDGLRLEAGKEIIINYKWEDGVFKCMVNDGYSIITREKETPHHYYQKGYYFIFGGRNKDSSIVSKQIVFNMKNTYIKVNGELVWGIEEG